MKKIREGGWKEPSQLDSLRSILGIFQDRAEISKANKLKRDAYTTKYLTALTAGYENIHDNNVLQQKLDSLSSYKQERIKNMSTDMMDIVKLNEQNLKNQMVENSDYDMKYNSMIGKHKDVQDWVQTMYDYDKQGVTQEEKEAILAGRSEKQFRLEEEEKFREMMQTYSYDIRNWYGRHGNRIDQYMMNDMVTSQSYMKSILDNWKADNKIDENEYNLYSNGISTGNYQDLQAFEAKRQNLADTLAKDDIGGFRSLKDEFDALNRGLESGSLSNSLYQKWINPDVVYDVDGEGYTKLQEDDYVQLQNSQLQIYGQLKKLNSSITGAAYQDLMYDDESFQKVPNAYGFDGSWDEYIKSFSKPAIPRATTSPDGTPMVYQPDPPQANESGYVAESLLGKVTSVADLSVDEKAKKLSEKDAFYYQEGSENRMIKMGEGDFVGYDEIAKAKTYGGRTGWSVPFKEVQYSERAKNLYKQADKKTKKLKKINNFIESLKGKDLSIKEEALLKKKISERNSLEPELQKLNDVLSDSGYYTDSKFNLRNKEIDLTNYENAKKWVDGVRKGFIVSGKDIVDPEKLSAREKENIKRAGYTSPHYDISTSGKILPK